MVGALPSPVLPGVSSPVEAKPLGLGLERELEPLTAGVLGPVENDKEIVGPLGAGVAAVVVLATLLVAAGGAETEPAIHLVTERGARVTRGRAVMGWVCRSSSSVIPLNSGLSP